MVVMRVMLGSEGGFSRYFQFGDDLFAFGIWHLRQLRRGGGVLLGNTEVRSRASLKAGPALEPAFPRPGPALPFAFGILASSAPIFASASSHRWSGFVGMVVGHFPFAFRAVERAYFPTPLAFPL
jgi:hypothetical protein